jgi:uncharacterized C2H2 Zn-finger protein
MLPTLLDLAIVLNITHATTNEATNRQHSAMMPLSAFALDAQPAIEDKRSSSKQKISVLSTRTITAGDTSDASTVPEESSPKCPEKSSLKCPKCEKIYKETKVLNSHLREVHTNKNLPCDYSDCSDLFKARRYVDEHIKTKYKTVKPEIEVPSAPVLTKSPDMHKPNFGHCTSHRGALDIRPSTASS